MATDRTVYSTKIPKFKDKVIYFQNDKGETSYVVASSYNGILRLSPNDSTSVFEKNQVQMGESMTSDSGTTINYTDAIVSDTLGALGDADISRKYIRVSDSDGQMVGIRFGDFDKTVGCTGVEFDTLNVIGITETNKKLFLMTNAENYQSDQFMVGSTSMPIMQNSVKYGRRPQWKCDMHDIHLTQNADGSYGDNACMIYGVSESSRRFRYGDVREVVSNYVMEALMSLNTVPTGSIHFVPITIEQYRQLAEKGSHNRFNGFDVNIEAGEGFDEDTTPYTKNENLSDPIVRDYLLCDGRVYSTRDFPELAKVLWGEKIQFWRTCPGTDELEIEQDEIDQYNGFSGKQVMFTQYNGRSDNYEKQHYGDNNEIYCHLPRTVNDGIRVENAIKLVQNQTPYTFRVPDLRRMFIRSVPTSVQDNHNVRNSKTDAFESNELTQTGTWMPDNMPFYRNQTPDGGKDVDKHFHFTHFAAYDFNFKRNQTGQMWSSGSSGGEVVYKSSINQLGGFDNMGGKHQSDLSQVACTLVDGKYTTGGCAMLTSSNAQLWNHGFTRDPGCKCGQFWGYEVHPYHFYFTVPEMASYSKKGVSQTTPTKGCTSFNMISYDPRMVTMDDLENIQNEVETTVIDYYYKDLRGEKELPDEVTDGAVVAPVNYGKENAPTHIICVPLIKI